MLSFWGGPVLLQSHQPRRGSLAACGSPAAPARNVPEVAELLNQPRMRVVPVTLARGKWSCGQHETPKAQGLSGPPRASFDLPALRCLSMPPICLEGESNKEKLIPFSIAPGPFLSLHPSIFIHFCFFHPKQAFSSSSEETSLHKTVSILSTSLSHRLTVPPATRGRDVLQVHEQGGVCRSCLLERSGARASLQPKT